MEPISERTSKEELISHSLELIDSQNAQLNTYKEQQLVLLIIISILIVFNLV